MKVYQTKEIRNIALLGGTKSGKTTLAEAMAFDGKVISRIGNISDKNTLSDYRDIEIERELSVCDSLLYAEFEDHKINIIDTPGVPDFIGEPLSALRVVEAGVVLINATSGIEVGTEIICRKAELSNTPVIFAINQLDHEKANFEDSIKQLTDSFGSRVTVVQYPVNIGPDFDAIIDLVLQKMIKYPKGGGAPEKVAIPESEQEKAAHYYKLLLEASAQGADDLMEKYFDTNDLTIDEMRRGIKLGLEKRNVFPVMCISAKKNIGVSRLLDFIMHNVTSPDEGLGIYTSEGDTYNINVNQPFSAFVFKTAKEAHLGDVAFMKITGGEMTEGMDFINTSTKNKDRISQIMIVAGKNKTKVEKAVAGDIVATIKLKEAKQNQTLAALNNESVNFAPIQFPDPIYTTAIKAEVSTDDEKLGTALNELHQSDPTLIVEYSKELKQLLLKGQGEYHILTAKWYLDNQYKIKTEFITPKIPYRETITKPAEAMYRHKKQSGGAGQFAEVYLMIEPYYDGMPNQSKYPIRGTEITELPWGGKLVFHNCIVGGAIDSRFLPAILKGIMEKMEEGPLTGSYARDIVVSVYDGKMHPVDSNEMAFKLAGRNAFKEAFKNANPKILEPVYTANISVPSDRLGDVMTDLQGRRGMVMGMEADGAFQVITAKVPLAEMNKYSTALSSLTSGRATYGMKFSEYSQVPNDVQAELLKAYEAIENEAGE